MYVAGTDCRSHQITSSAKSGKRHGNLGDYRSVGEGVCELKIDYGPGYRVYFGQIGSTIVLLLCGGNKSTQEQDIRRAIEYWTDYRRRENANQ